MKKSIYPKLLERYIEETKNIRSGYPYAPFIPHVFPNYEKAETKIFYFGKDTYYWLEEKELTNYNIEEYILKNSKVVNPSEHITLYKNNTNSFWPFIAQLHLFIKHGEMITNFAEVTQEQADSLNEIGYGNLHAIEVPKSLQNEGIWTDINPTEYTRLVQKSDFLNRIKYVLDIWEPDFIFILSWENYLEIFNGLEYDQLSEWYEDNLREVYKINGYKTKIIWTSHPRRFSFLGTNSQSMVKYLAKTMYNLKQM